jgi:RHS repeat-associated protein
MSANQNFLSNLSRFQDAFYNEKYRFGFNGKENDNEVKGEGSQQDYGMRIYDTRLGRFLSVDPLMDEYPWNSTYAFAENDVIRCIDLDGLEKILYIINIDKDKITTTKITLATAGPLGNGVAVQLNKHNKTSYYYGEDVSPKNLQQFVTSYETCQKTIYKIKDKGNGKTSIIGGIGHKLTPTELKKFKVGDQISDAQIAKWFKADIERFQEAVDDNVEGASKMTKYQKDALTDFGYCTRNASTRLAQFHDSKFFLKFLGGGVGMIKRRIGEFVLFDIGKYLKFEKVQEKSKKSKQLETLFKNSKK